MRKKLMMTIVITITTAMIIGCGKITNAMESSVKYGDCDYMEEIASNRRLVEYRDSETGVHYFKSNDGGLCPRYNADGTLYVSERR